MLIAFPFFFSFLKLLYDHTEPIPGEEQWPVVGQFSSIGSMGIDKTKWLASEFQRTLTTLGKPSLRPVPPVYLVYYLFEGSLFICIILMILQMS